MKPILQTILATLLLATQAPLQAESLAETLERGVFQQDTRNDPASALRIYQEIVGTEGQSRGVVSEARYRMAMCLITLGEEAKGRDALEALARDAAADKTWAGKAAAGLDKTRFVHPAPWKSGEIAIYRMQGPGKQDMGFMMAAVKEAAVGDKPGWASYFIRAGAQWGISCAWFSQETFEPVSSRFFMNGFGDYLSEYPGEGAVLVKNADGGELKWQRKAGESTLPIFDNDQVIQLLRLLPQTIGTKVQSEVAIPFNPAVIPFTMEVTAEEMVETDAGDFDCVKIVTNIGQDFWVSRDEHKRLVKMRIGVASVEASKFIDWNPDKPTGYTSRKHGTRLEFPAGVLWGPPDEKEKGLRVHVYSTDFSAFGGIIDLRTTAELPESSGKSSQAWAKADLAEGAKQFEEFETVHQAALDLPGWKAWSSRTRQRSGEVTGFTYHVHAVGTVKSISMRLAYPKDGEAAVEKFAAELLKGISFE